MRRWLFLPIDDRPITSRFPTLIAPLGEIELLTPPRELLGSFLTPGDGRALARWLEERAPEAEGAILSLEMLAYGGLIASRTQAVTLEEALGRLAVIERLRDRGLTVLASSVLMRLGITGSSPESMANHELIQRWSQAVASPARASEARVLEERIPYAALEEYRAARQRNHRVNAEAVRLVGKGVIDFLLLLQEDCTPEGVHRLEQAALGATVANLGVTDRVHMLPGADEGALLLLARAALSGKQRPQIEPVYSVEGTAGSPAPYEDRPLRETVERQILASGAALGPGGIQLFVNTPVQQYGDANLFIGTVREPGELDPVSDGAPAFVAQIRQALEAGKPAAVADVAFANGADPRFTDLLLQGVPWSRLHGYAAWNTAGNTLGTAVAMAVLRHLDEGRHERLHQEALLTRLLDDYAYQTCVRPQVAAVLRERGVNTLNLGASSQEASRDVGVALARIAPEILRSDPGASGYRLERFAAALPWPRIFEVAIEVGLSR